MFTPPTRPCISPSSPSASSAGACATSPRPRAMASAGPAGKVASFTVIGDHDGSHGCRGDLMSAVVLGPDGNLFGAEVSDQQNGTYVVSYRPQLEGEHLVSASPSATSTSENSPFKVLVKSGRSYVGIGLPGLSAARATAMASSGRPWGGGVDKEGWHRSGGRPQQQPHPGVCRAAPSHHKPGTLGSRGRGNLTGSAGVACDAAPQDRGGRQGQSSHPGLHL